MQKVPRIFPVVTLSGLVAFKLVQVAVMSRASPTPDAASGRVHAVLLGSKISHAPSYVSDIQMAVMIIPAAVMLAGAIAWAVAKVAQAFGARLGPG